jgi:hypothetical protein
MLNKTTSRKFIAPRRQERKERNISPDLARFASLREAFLFQFCKPNSRENFKYLWIDFNRKSAI